MNIVFQKFFFLLICFGLSVGVSSCDYKKTDLELGSLFDPTWDFSESTKLEFDHNFVEIKSGKAQLKVLDLEDHGEDFNEGIHVGTSASSNNISFLTKNSDRLDIRNLLPNKASDLVGYWRFDGNFTDLMFANNGIVFSSPEINSDSKIGSGSLLLDGIGDSLDLSNSEQLSPGSGAMTIALWLKTSKDYTATSGFVYQDYGDNKDNHINISFASAGKVRVQFRDENNNSSLSQSVTDINDGSWHHVVGIRNGTKTSLYVDGVLEAENTNGLLGNVNVADGSSPNFGRLGFYDISFFDGLIDEFSIWKTALSDEEVAKLHYYHSLKFHELSQVWTPQWDSIVGYWKLDGNWQDSSGSTNLHSATAGGNASPSSTAKVGSHSGSFDGNSDYLQISNHSDFEVNNNFTVAGWFNFLDPATEHMIFSNWDPINSEGFRFFIDNGAPAFLRVQTGDGASMINMPGGTVEVSPGEWYHFLFTRSGGVNQFYLNGVLKQSWASAMVTALGENPMIAVRHTTALSSQDFEGLIDDIAFWKTSLTSEEAIQIYHRQKQKYSAHYDSRVMSAGSSEASWPSLSWSTVLPFGKELVGDFDLDGVPEGEAVADYSALTSSLAQGLLASWSFNETTFDSVEGTKDVRDLSGNGLHLEDSGTTVFLGRPGRLATGVSFDGNGLLLTPSPKDPRLDMTTGSLSAWVKVTDAGTSYRGIVVKEGAYGIFLHNNRPAVYNWGAAVSEISNVTINDGEWHHLVMTFSENVTNGSHIFLDGVNIHSFSMSIADQNERLNVGSGFESFVLQRITGSVDEVAVWNRQLSGDEVKELYRRGVNRIEFQVKSCVDVTCNCKGYSASPLGSSTDCDGDTILNAVDLDDIFKARFKGPGGDGTTYYSELFNRKGSDFTFNCGTNTSDSDSNICVDDEINFLKGPKPTLPVVSFSQLPLTAKPTPNPYFQYRAYLGADDNIACSGSACLPELSSVSLNANDEPKYYGGLQEIMPLQSLEYTKITSATVIADDCVTFQLSHNGSDYFYLNSDQWVSATLIEHRSSREELENYIAKFGQQYGPGSLYIKTFLETNSSQTLACSIGSIDVVSTNK